MLACGVDAGASQACFASYKAVSGTDLAHGDRTADLARNAGVDEPRPIDLDDPFTHALRQNYNDLHAEQVAASTAIAELDATDESTSRCPGTADVALLDALPVLARKLTNAPEELMRALFEITQLNVRLDDEGGHVTIMVRLPTD